jgi:hypothetical protein
MDLLALYDTLSALMCKSGDYGVPATCLCDHITVYRCDYWRIATPNGLAFSNSEKLAELLANNLVSSSDRV